MRILMLIQWCRPEPDFKCIPMARELMRRGHEVQVLTGFPNYPGGQVYPGYRVRPWQREVLDGVPVTRLALYPSHDSSSLWRALNYGSFALSSAFLGPWLVQRPDVAYVYNPMGLPALVFKWLRGVPFVYDIGDLWPDTLGTTGMLKNRLFLGLLRHFFKFVYQQAGHITVLSPGFKRALEEAGVPPNKVSVIYNWADEDNLHPVEPDAVLRQQAGFEGRFNVVYAGAMGQPQGLRVVLEAASLLLETCPTALFTMVGRGTELEDLKASTKHAGLTNVQFLPQRPATEIGALLACADALLVHLRSDPLFEITIPSKTQASLAMGRPVLTGVNGNAADLVRKSGGGLCFPSGDARALAAAVIQLAAMTPAQRAAMGRNGALFYRNELSLASGVQRFEHLFFHLANPPGHSIAAEPRRAPH